jgi:hypothetical protein
MNALYGSTTGSEPSNASSLLQHPWMVSGWPKTARYDRQYGLSP